MTSKSAQLEIFLQTLTMQLKHVELWQVAKPSPQALSSTQPFCLNTLTFEQWLQFVFIEKLHTMIISNLPLPTQISVSPMGEEAFKNLGKDATDIINTLADIDELLSGEKGQPNYAN
ncbi:YqcC family protein [Thalassotalea psychrophila]|uniref:YqcC family protein n=1 Tax=Thalassotalea psychrophila TaxID=3065647 RepID=A0ABY9TQA2_9GAMM|nr:YqcC family protein [Colwelliaceae bacterium SQ149]